MACAITSTVYLTLINMTPYDWQRIGEPTKIDPSNNGLGAWGDFPVKINSGQLQEAKVQLCHGLFTNDWTHANGTVTYQVGDQPGQNVEIFVNGANNQPSLWSLLDGVSTLGNADQQYRKLGWKTWPDSDYLSGDAWIPFVLAGNVSSFVGNAPPADWMHQSLPYLGCNTLQDVILPASHDSGTSAINNRTSIAIGANTLTQHLNIYEQLVAGVRLFDIRPIWYEGEWWTGHYNRGGIEGGANGQSLAAVISNITEFNNDYDELIILNVNNYLNRSTDQWNSNLPEDFFVELMDLLADIPNLYVTNAETTLTSLTLNEFINNGPAVIVRMTTLPGTGLLESVNRHKQGFYYEWELPFEGVYSNTDNPTTMQNDQYSQFQNWSSNPGDTLFQVSWTMTLSAGEVGDAFDSIENRANIVNLRLAEYGNPPDASIVDWWSKNRIPNSVSIDFVREDDQLTGLCLAMNRWYRQCAY